MIYFVTNEPKHLKKYRKRLFDNIEVLEDNKDTLLKFRIFLVNEMNSTNRVLGYDVESNGLDAWENNTHLRIFGTEETQFIFHTPYCNLSPYLSIIGEFSLTLLGHNIKFDIKFLMTENGIEYPKVYDTMIAEQRIYMKSGMRFSLDQLCVRYLDVYPDEMDKSIRMEFVGKDVYTFNVLPKHLYYGAGDVKNLFPIVEKQEALLMKYDLDFLVRGIEFPLINIIAKAEITGFPLDKDNWIKVYNENLVKKFAIECSLDTEVRTLRDTTFSKEDFDRIFMIGGKWDNVRKHNKEEDLINNDGTTNVLDLFGEPMSSKTLTGVKKKALKAPNNLNYGSDTTIVEIFGRLGEPVLTKANTLVIPSFTKTQKVDKSLYSFTTGVGAFHEYLIQLPNTRMATFINLLLEHRGLATATSTFGINIINKISSITGNIHTEFRQCAADTGRFQSGGGEREPDKINFQNIPSKSSFAIRLRNCFLAKKGYSIGTHDLSGAELIIMCSLSQDMKLLRIARDEDIHSYVAQNCWRNIYNYRAHKLVKAHNDLRLLHGSTYRDEALIADINKNIKLANTYVVDKSCKKVRTSFKPMTFGVIYGMYAAKAGKTLNISKEEGQIVIDFIKGAFPDVINMVESASAFAKTHGYLILNNRTNSRAWFPTLIKLLRGELDENKDFGLISKALSEARNIRIQGTQADMIKECTVVLQQWIDANNLTNEITILSWIHDEIVDEHPHYMDGRSAENSKYIQNYPYSPIVNKPFELVLDNKEVFKSFSFPEIKRRLMIEVCNRYLKNVTMDVDYDVEPFWTK